MRRNISTLKRKSKRTFFFKEFGILIAFIILCVIFTISNPGFATLRNLLNLGRQISTIGIMSIGMTFLIIGRNFDLSVGSMFAFVSSIVAVLMSNGVNENEFSVIIDNKVFKPIPDKLNFVPDKMPGKISIEAGEKYTSKVVWVLPKRVFSKVLVFKPSFSQIEIKYNLVDVNQ